MATSYHAQKSKLVEKPGYFVINHCTSSHNPLRWKDMGDGGINFFRRQPLKNQLSYPNMKWTKYLFLKNLMDYKEFFKAKAF